MGELARMPGSPQLPETPLELITPRPGQGYSLFNRMVWPVVGAISGLGTSLLSNALMKRPIWAGIHRHILLTGAFSYLAIFIRDVKFAERAESDAVIKHYISLHPEDFPPFERKRWSEVYVPFKPSR